MVITKADGTTEEFDPDKLRSSLKRAGAQPPEIEHVVREIEKRLRPNDSTQKIYQRAFTILREDTHTTAAKYSLRRALFGLGPTGFPFEEFIARLFQEEGYTTVVGTEVRGKCALHEIDIAGYKADHSFVAEAKFHLRPGLKSDLQVALYSYARFLDLENYKVCPEDTCGIKTSYLVTNTKFTSAAVEYANCIGLELISWGLEGENSLQYRIERAGLYPVTAIAALSDRDKERLLAQKIILCRDILDRPHVLADYGIRGKKLDRVLVEARELCTAPHSEEQN